MFDEGRSDHDISTVLKCHTQGDELNIYCIRLDRLMFLLFFSSITVINRTLFKEKTFSSKYSLMHVGTVHFYVTNILFLPIYCFCILLTLAQHSGSHVGNIFVGQPEFRPMPAVDGLEIRQRVGPSGHSWSHHLNVALKNCKQDDSPSEGQSYCIAVTCR